MNKKRKIDDVLESIFNLIQDAHNELKESEKGNEIPNNLVIEKNNSVNTPENLIEKKLVISPKNRDGDWSDLKFKKIELTEDLNISSNSNLKEHNLEHNFSDDHIRDVFLDSLNNWQKSNLKNLTENIYQEIVKESLKDRLK